MSIRAWLMAVGRNSNAAIFCEAKCPSLAWRSLSLSLSMQIIIVSLFVFTATTRSTLLLFI